MPADAADCIVPSGQRRRHCLLPDACCLRSASHYAVGSPSAMHHQWIGAWCGRLTLHPAKSSQVPLAGPQAGSAIVLLFSLATWARM